MLEAEVHGGHGVVAQSTASVSGRPGSSLPSLVTGCVTSASDFISPAPSFLFGGRYLVLEPPSEERWG